MTFLSTAMFALRPAHNFRVINDTELIWEDERPQPTQTEIDSKIAELQADYDSRQYQRDRAAAYPSWQDQLDKIFHSGINAWKADIQKVKDQYPKP